MADKKHKPTPPSRDSAKHIEGFEPDWEGTCEVCGARPIVPFTGLCGPCTWGEAETADGNW